MKRHFSLTWCLPVALALCMVFPNAVRSQIIDIEMSTNGIDADVPPGPSINVGDAVTWSYSVENVFSATLTDVSVADNQLGPVSCPTTILNPGDSMTCVAFGTALAGQYSNLATATATLDDGGRLRTVSDSDPSHYFGLTSVPDIDIEKATNGYDADTAPGPGIVVGDPVTWNFVVSNTGSENLINVIVVDDLYGQATCPLSSLTVGESMTCTINGTATAGQHMNVGRATGTTESGTQVADEDPSHYFGSSATPEIDIEKSTNGLDADTAPGPDVTVGNPVVWTYVVTNTGTGVLTNIIVSDDQIGPIPCPRTSLATGESMTCTANGTATAGQYVNIGSAEASSEGGRSVSDADTSHYFGNRACTPEYLPFWDDNESLVISGGATPTATVLLGVPNGFKSLEILDGSNNIGLIDVLETAPLLRSDMLGSSVHPGTLYERLEFTGESGDAPTDIIAVFGPREPAASRFLFRLTDQANCSLDIDPVIDFGVPSGVALHGNYPNPFNPTTQISFDLPEADDVRLSVYDVMGREVRTLISGRLDAGTHQATWDGTTQAGVQAASGIYLYRLDAGSVSYTKQMILMK